MNKLLIFVLGLGILLRVILLSFSPQYYDMSTFEAWGNSVYDQGLLQTYSSMWSDYLPLPMQIFGFVYQLAEILKVPFAIFFRLFWMIIELSLILLITKLSPKEKRFQIFSILFLFPPFLINTAWWGQIDSIPSLLTLTSYLLLTRTQRSLLSGIFFALAVAIKPIMIIAGLVFLITGIRQKALIKLLVSGLVVLSVTAVGATSSYHPLTSLQIVFEKATYQASMYPGTSINAWNAWSIGGTFWSRDDVPVLGFTAQMLGYLMYFVILVILTLSWKRLNFSDNQGVWIIGLLLLSFYVFTTRMHERHMMFALPFLVYGASFVLNKFIVSMLSMLYTLNLWAALYWVNNDQSWPFSKSLLSFFSYLIVFCCLVLVVRHATQPLSISLSTIIKKLKPHLIAIFIILIAFFLRTINISHPKAMIFDEVYHSFTAQEYLKNNIEAWEWWTIPPQGFAYEWTHPPVAKYGMVIGMLIFGNDSLGYRIGSAFMGNLSIVGLYFLALRLTHNKQVATLAILFSAIEGLHLVQSRTGMNDAYMLCFLVWALAQSARNSYRSAAILFGLALASKWSSVYGLIPLALIYISNNKIKISNVIFHFFKTLKLVLIALCIYLLSFIPFLVAGHEAKDLLELHKQMWYYHTNLVATHNYQSTPKDWVLVMRPVWYWVDYNGNQRSNIYAQGNPIILWAGAIATILLLLRLKKYLLLIVLPTVFTLPWIFSPRIMFFYHYLPTAFFLTIPLAVIINKFPNRWKVIFLALSVVSFILLSPMYYGIETKNEYWNTLFSIFPTWK